MKAAERLDAINAVELYLSGKTIRHLCSLVKCNESTVSVYLKEKGVKTRSKGKPLTVYPVGSYVGVWEVLSGSLENKPKRHCAIQLCRCRVCGYQMRVTMGKHAQNSTRCMKCKSSKVLTDTGEYDIKYIINYYFERHLKRCLRRRNKVSKLELNITADYLLDLFHRQKGKCALSGMDLIGKSIKLAELPLSLDRIDSNVGYVKGNVQWVHKDINMMKQSYSNDRFIGMCCMIAMNHAYSKSHEEVFRHISLEEAKEIDRMMDSVNLNESSKCS